MQLKPVSVASYEPVDTHVCIVYTHVERHFNFSCAVDDGTHYPSAFEREIV